VQSRLLSLLGLFEPVVEFFMFLEALEVNTVPIGVSGTNSKAKGGGEVKPEAFPEFSGNGGDGHLVSEEGEDDEGGFA